MPLKKARIYGQRRKTQSMKKESMQGSPLSSNSSRETPVKKERPLRENPSRGEERGRRAKLHKSVLSFPEGERKTRGCSKKGGKA